MSKKTRLIILLACILCFFVFSPYIILYSLGYRIDFESKKVVATGGIYVRTYPPANEVVFDSKTGQKPGVFNNAVFVQSLLPKDHTVLVKKEGYYDYYKVLPVEEKEVTKLENVLLLKKDIVFADMADNLSYFSLAPNQKNIITVAATEKGSALEYFSVDNPAQRQLVQLSRGSSVLNAIWADDSSKAVLEIKNDLGAAYYLFNPQKQQQNITRMSAPDISARGITFNPQDSQEIFFLKNKTIYSLKNSKAQAVISNCLAYKIIDNSIWWLSGNGVLSKSDFAAKSTEEIIPKESAFKIKNASYSFVQIAGAVYLKENNVLYSVNQQQKKLVPLKAAYTGYELLSSPDNKNLLYYNEKSIYLHTFSEDAVKNNVMLFGAAASEKISNCFWINNDYFIFSSGNRIIISEIDYRGNINKITLPQSLPLADGKVIALTNPEIFFSRQDSKIYIFTNNTLLSSEKITP